MGWYNFNFQVGPSYSDEDLLNSVNRFKDSLIESGLPGVNNIEIIAGEGMAKCRFNIGDYPHKFAYGVRKGLQVVISRLYVESVDGLSNVHIIDLVDNHGQNYQIYFEILYNNGLYIIKATHRDHNGDHGIKTMCGLFKLSNNNFAFFEAETLQVIMPDNDRLETIDKVKFSKLSVDEKYQLIPARIINSSLNKLYLEYPLNVYGILSLPVNDAFYQIDGLNGYYKDNLLFIF